MTSTPNDGLFTEADVNSLREKLVAFGAGLTPGEELALRLLVARAIEPRADVQGLALTPPPPSPAIVPLGISLVDLLYHPLAEAIYADGIGKK
jgi:hypothetical protein